MNTIYIEQYPCSDGQYEAWVDTEDGKQRYKYPSIAACRRRWEPIAYRVIIVTH